MDSKYHNRQRWFLLLPLGLLLSCIAAASVACLCGEHARRQAGSACASTHADRWVVTMPAPWRGRQAAVGR